MSEGEDDRLLMMADALPDLDVDDLTAERVRRAAHAAMAARPPRSLTRRLYRSIEPAVAIGVAAVSLYWVLSPIVMHYR